MTLPVMGDRRLIPAGAGKTKPVAYNTSHSTAHPRGGGENMCQALPTRMHNGSSPRGRGKRQALDGC